MGRGRRQKWRAEAKNKRRDGAGPHKKKTPYADSVRENQRFEDYYKKQAIVPESEWEDFLTTVRSPLPAAFRITGSKSEAEQLLTLIKHNFFSEMDNTQSRNAPSPPDTTSTDDTACAGATSISTANTATVTGQADVTASSTREDNQSDMEQSDTTREDNSVSQENEPIKPPRCLNWYPNQLAWQLEYSRVSIRTNNTLKKLHSFLVSESESGNISRQEAVSMIPPLLMHIQSHHKVLDMCAAPGSKTAQIIEYLHADSSHPMPDGFVVGNDVDNKRCYMMVHQVKRLQSPNFIIINHDATRLPNMNYRNPKTREIEQLMFDRILCDVPCSGDGTLRKNPEVWRTWGPGHAINLHSVQLRVLQRGLELLNTGGRLVYSTCSFNPIENEAIIAATLNKYEGSVRLVDCSEELVELKRNPGLLSWKVHTKSGDWFDSFLDVPQAKQCQVRPSMFPQSNMADLNIDRCMRILPHHQNTGGFFIAVLEKVAPLPSAAVKTEKQPSGVAETSSSNSPTKVAAGEETAQSGNGSVTAEGQTVAKKVKYAGFREDPFCYLSPDDSQWPSIKKFYGIDDSFDMKQLMVRSKESMKKRNIYLSSQSMRNVMIENQEQIKYINTGVKVLARSEHALCVCSHRLVQDGISSIQPFVKLRRISITKHDVVELLTQENPFLSRLSPSTQAHMLEVDVGGVLMLYDHIDKTGLTSEICMTGWRGKTSCRVYVPKYERHHYLRLCGVDPDLALVDAEWAVKSQTDGEDGGAGDHQDPCGEDGTNGGAAEVEEMEDQVTAVDVADTDNNIGNGDKLESNIDKVEEKAAVDSTEVDVSVEGEKMDST